MTSRIQQSIKFLGFFFVACAFGELRSIAGEIQGGVMTFTSQTGNFGKIYQGQVVNFRFPFRNSGDGPLRIKGVHASCGCTVAEFERDRSYAPGEEGVIEVKFDSARFAGSVRKTVSVMTDERGKPERLLTLVAQVVEEFRVDPPVIDFGEVLANDGAHKVAMVRPVNGFKLVVSGAEFDPKVFDVTIKPGPEEWAIDVYLRPGQQAGFFRQDIYVTTNSAKNPRFLVPIRANIRGNIAYGPEYLEFGAVDRNQTMKRSINVELGKDFHILGSSAQVNINGNPVRDGKEYLKVDLPKADGGRSQIGVVLTNSSAYAGSVHGSVQLQTDDPLQKEIRVDFYAFFR